MNKIKKIIFAAGIVITIAIASVATFAAELSQTLQQCTNYINNPSEQAAKENADALHQCYENDVCQNQLSSLPNCAKTLSQWYMNYSQAPTKTVAPVIIQTPVSAAPSAQPSSTTEVEPTIQPAATTNGSNQQKQKENKPSINW